MEKRKTNSKTIIRGGKHCQVESRKKVIEELETYLADHMNDLVAVTPKDSKDMETPKDKGGKKNSSSTKKRKLNSNSSYLTRDDF